MFLEQVPDSIAFSVFGLPVHWYGLLIAGAALIGYQIVMHFSSQRQLSTKAVGDILFYSIFFGFIGARLYHVLSSFSYYREYPLEIIAVWQGGLALHGGLLVGGLVFWYLAYKKNISFWKLADCTTIALAFVQGVGRWGNYFNQELYGKPTEVAWKLFISPQHRLPGYESYDYFHPVFLYESILNLFLAGVLFLLYKSKRFTDGMIFLFYIIGYSSIRFGMEFLRIDPVAMVGVLKWPQVVSLILIGTAIMVMRRQFRFA